MKVEIDQVEKGFILEKFGYFTVFCKFLREYFQRYKWFAKTTDDVMISASDCFMVLISFTLKNEIWSCWAMEKGSWREKD